MPLLSSGIFTNDYPSTSASRYSFFSSYDHPEYLECNQIWVQSAQLVRRLTDSGKLWHFFKVKLCPDSNASSTILSSNAFHYSAQQLTSMEDSSDESTYTSFRVDCNIAIERVRKFEQIRNFIHWRITLSIISFPERAGSRKKRMQLPINEVISRSAQGYAHTSRNMNQCKSSHNQNSIPMEGHLHPASRWDAWVVRSTTSPDGHVCAILRHDWALAQHHWWTIRHLQHQTGHLPFLYDTGSILAECAILERYRPCRSQQLLFAAT